MTSARYAPAVCVLLAIALVPTLIHSYGASEQVDAYRTDAIPTSLMGYESVSSGRVRNWGLEHFDSRDWIERDYAKKGDEVRLTVVRSYDPKSLYHHPELAVAYGQRFGATFARHEVVRIAAAPQLPIHVLHPTPGGNAVALYVLHYDGEFIEDPVWFQIRNAATLLFSRRKPMTLFFAHDLAAPPDARVEDLPAAALLTTAIETFLAPR
jgi:hypothetical protein